MTREDLTRLEAAGLKPTRGDIRCIVFGHLVRAGDLAICGRLGRGMPPTRGRGQGLGRDRGVWVVRERPEAILGEDFTEAPFAHDMLVGEATARTQEMSDAVSF